MYIAGYLLSGYVRMTDITRAFWPYMDIVTFFSFSAYVASLAEFQAIFPAIL